MLRETTGDIEENVERDDGRYKLFGSLFTLFTPGFESLTAGGIE